MKNIVVEYTIRVVEQWQDEYADEKHINFARNDGCWCVTNLFEELAKKGPCACPNTSGKYIREATDQDILELGKPMLI